MITTFATPSTINISAATRDALRQFKHDNGSVSYTHVIATLLERTENLFLNGDKPVYYDVKPIEGHRVTITINAELKQYLKHYIVRSGSHNYDEAVRKLLEVA